MKISPSVKMKPKVIRRLGKNSRKNLETEKAHLETLEKWYEKKDEFQYTMPRSGVFRFGNRHFRIEQDKQYTVKWDGNNPYPEGAEEVSWK